jgi:hypothetical protein
LPDDHLQGSRYETSDHLRRRCGAGVCRAGPRQAGQWAWQRPWLRPWKRLRLRRAWPRLRHGRLPARSRQEGLHAPGQAKKLYRGERWRSGYGRLYAYRSIPYDIRRRYDLDPYDRYYYSNGYLYRVDPRTLLIEQVISALLYR